MKIHVYAGLKDYFEPEFEIDGVARNTAELIAQLLRINAKAETMLASCRFAVAEGFIDKEYTLKSYETVVIIPPSSGG